MMALNYGVDKHASTTALNMGTWIYLMNFLGMFNVLTQQKIAKVKPYLY